MGNEGGFVADDIVAVAAQLDALDGAHCAGITTFPALLFDEDAGTVEPTPNMHTLEMATAKLRDAVITDIEVNAPGTTSIAVLKMLADAGGYPSRTGQRPRRDNAAARGPGVARTAGAALSERGVP